MRSALLAAAIFSSLLTAQIATAQETSQAAEAETPSPRPRITYLDKAKTIYITDFNTSAAASPPLQTNTAPIAGVSMGSPRLNGTDSGPIEPGQHVTKLISDTLLHEFKKAGYKAKIIEAHDPRPDEGMLIEGVFTELGKDGQLRRATIEAGYPVDGVQLYVTTANLLRPAKPLYEVVKPDVAGRAATMPIRLNPEVATLKFSVPGNFDDKAAKKTAEQIVAELERLTLQAESEGLAGSDDPLNKYSKP